MTKEEKRARLQAAVAAHELYAYLIGQKSYGYVSNYADAPTDSQVVFSSIVEYVEGDTTHPLWLAFEQEWLRMSQDQEYAWLAVYYLYEYMSFFHKRKSLPIDKAQALATTILASVAKQKPQLQANKKWVGANYPRGLWDDAIRVVDNTNEMFNLHLQLD